MSPSPARAARRVLLLASVFLPSLALAQTAPPGLVFVTGRDALVAHDAATGEERARLPTGPNPSDMVATPEGHVFLNDRGAGTILVVDAATLREVRRFPSSTLGGTTATHSYPLTTPSGRRLIAVMHDGTEARTPPGTPPADSAVTLVGADPARPDFATIVGEVRLGRGHHKAAVSRDGGRLTISNIGDCAEVVGVYATEPPARVAAIRAEVFGLDGGSPERRCDPTRAAGVRPAVHGAGMARTSGLHVHNANGTGHLVVVDADANPPTARALPTSGTGGAAVASHPGGRFLYAPQNTPRGGTDPCRIGQVAVVDGAAPAVVAEVPLLMEGPGCTADAGGVRPAYAFVAPDGRSLFITLGTLNAAAPDRARHLAVFDLADPTRPVQVASIPVGGNAGHRDGNLSADGRWLVVPNGADGTVTVVDTARREAVRTFRTVDAPSRVLPVDPPRRAASSGAPGGATTAAR